MTYKPNTTALPGTYPNLNQHIWQGVPNYPNLIPPVAALPINVPVAATSKVTLAEAFKPKKAGKNTSHVIFVLDDSASMQSCRSQTIAGYNEYLKLQKEDEVKTGIKTFVSLYKFNGSSVTKVFDHTPVQQVESLTDQTYNPRGSTNLYDALGGVMMQINAELTKVAKKERESVIITILTDGEENTSRTFDSSTIKAMLEKAEGKNWGFMYLGANVDAFASSSILGFNASNTMQFNTANATETIRSASAMAGRMKSAYASGMDTSATYATTAFTDAERASAVGGKIE